MTENYPENPPAPAGPAEPPELHPWNGADIDAIYTDRAHVLALLSLHYPAYIAYSDAATPEWLVLTLETPQGQLTWHISPRDLDLFDHVRRADAGQAAAAYDGHSTDEKHARIRARLAWFAPTLTG